MPTSIPFPLISDSRSFLYSFYKKSNILQYSDTEGTKTYLYSMIPKIAKHVFFKKKKKKKKKKKTELTLYYAWSPRPKFSELLRTIFTILTEEEYIHPQDFSYIKAIARWQSSLTTVLGSEGSEGKFNWVDVLERRLCGQSTHGHVSDTGTVSSRFWFTHLQNEDYSSSVQDHCEDCWDWK